MTKLIGLSSRLRFIILATFLGNSLQWFDFSLFGMLLPLFTQIFFPQQGHSVFFILFALGSLTRPLGGLFFGYLGDTSGRKAALIRTILLMIIPVILVAFLPSYKQIGIASTVLLGALYLFQGFCVGGEFPGSVVFLLESAPPDRRGYVGCWSYIGVILGMFLVSINIYIMEKNLSPAELLLWGWRLPYLMGALIGLVGFYMRFFLRETPIFQEAKSRGVLLQKPILETFLDHKKMLLKAIGINILDVVCFNFILVFSNYYLSEYLHLSLDGSFKVSVFTGLVILIFLPIFGKLGDRIGNIRLAKWAAAAMVLCALPLYLLMSQGSLLLIYVSQGLLAILLASYVCNMPALLYTLFPTSVRYTCIGFTLNFTVAVFGGTAPLITNYLVKYTAAPLIPSAYLILGALLALLFLRNLKPAEADSP